MLANFQDYEHQESADLEWGGQQEACAELLEKDLAFRDHSITGDWDPGED